MKTRRSALRSRNSWLIFLLIFSFTNVLAGDRFIIGTGDSNNTVIDTTTGLMWDRSPEAVARTGFGASVYCDNLDGSNNRGGYTDWRLPTVKELLSLVDYRYKSPALSDTSGTNHWKTEDSFFLGNSSRHLWYSFVWSSTLLIGGGVTWGISLDSGDSETYDTGSQSGAAWCVRGSMYSENFSSDYYHIVGASNVPSEKEIVYVNNTECPEVNCTNKAETVCVDNEVDCSSYCSLRKEIVYVNQTANNTVYVNNCTGKNLSVEINKNISNTGAGETSKKSLDYNSAMITLVVMGLVILGLIISFAVYVARHFNN